VSPAVAADAPVDANAPVCVASDCSGSSAGQQTGGANAEAGSGGGNGGTQTAEQSLLTVQIGSANVSPVAVVEVPVNANTPICVASDCSNSNASQPPSGTEPPGGGTEPPGGGTEPLGGGT
jgi:hypothetical protein